MIDYDKSPLFTKFLYTLRALKVPVGTQEWISLMEALVLNLHDSSLDDFYWLARSLLIKSEALYDAFDQAFLWCFKSATSLDIGEEVKKWLEKNVDPSMRPDMPEAEKLKWEELRKKLLERLKEQKEEHHGGSHWVGTGGTSPFGHSGSHPTGMRIGGAGGGRMAMKVAEERRFANYRNDRVLDTRQFKVALKRLRFLDQEGRATELDLDESIDQTCKNAGEIELVFVPPEKNQTELILLMDVGGTMDPYAELVESLFSAAHSLTHFKSFQHYYFHNCIYSKVYTDMYRNEWIATDELFKKFRKSHKVIYVGDACMHPYELFEAGGGIDSWDGSGGSGLTWLKLLKDHFKQSVWLNPENERYWNHPTIETISKLIPMFPLSVEGLTNAVNQLKKG